MRSSNDDSASTIGDVITVTATLSDEDGNAVADGTRVNFSVSDLTGLHAIGSNHASTTPADETANGPTSKDGVAEVQFTVVGAGVSVVSATAGGVSAVAVIVSTAGAKPPRLTSPTPSPSMVSRGPS